MRLEYQEVTMQQLLDHWVKDYEFPVDGESLFTHESFYDPTKETAVIKLYINEAGEDE